MDVDWLADLIRAGTRVKVGPVEGVLTGFRSLKTLAVDGVDVPWAPVELLEPLDEERAAAVREEQAEADRKVTAQRAAARVAKDLAVLDDAALAALLADPVLKARLEAARSA